MKSDARRVMNIDVTWHELGQLAHKGGVSQKIMQFLHDQWVGDIPSRAHETRIGTVDVSFDEDGALHLDFRTRFVLNEEQKDQLLESLSIHRVLDK